MKKSTYNFITGIFAHLINISLGIIIPRLILINLGSEANGLISTINQMHTYIGLFEAGVGVTALQSLYGFVANNECRSINAVLSAVDKSYRKTGILYCIFTFAIAIAYSLMIPSGIPKVTIFIIILLSGITNAIKFFLHGKYFLLLQTEGKTYIVVSIIIITNVIFYIAEITFIFLKLGLIAIFAAQLGAMFIQAMLLLAYMNNNYQWLDLSVKPDYSSVAQKKSALVHQISGLIFSSTDILIITFVCGLKVASIYSMYTLLCGTINAIVSTINNSITHKLGQAYNKDIDEYRKLHDIFEVYNLSLNFSLYCIAITFILPFINLYTSGVTDVIYNDFRLLLLFITMNLLSNIRTSSNQLINYAGHFKLTQWRSALESAINVIISIICVLIWGIYGVMFGTIIALLYRTNDMIIYANKRILHRSPWPTYRRCLVNTGVFVVVTVIQTYIPYSIDSYTELILRATICCVIVIPIFIASSMCFDKSIMRYSFSYIKSINNR